MAQIFLREDCYSVVEFAGTCVKQAIFQGELGALVVDSQTLNREVLGLFAAGVGGLFPVARHINFPEYWSMPRK